MLGVALVDSIPEREESDVSPLKDLSESIIVEAEVGVEAAAVMTLLLDVSLKQHNRKVRGSLTLEIFSSFFLSCVQP